MVSHGGLWWRKRCLVVFSLGVAAAVCAQPAPPVRVIAEWEPAVGTLITWPLGIPQALVVELAREEKLFVLARSAQDENSARATFSAWGVNLNHVEFIRAGHNSHWTRDWGPHQVFDGQGRWGIVDPIFRGYPWVNTPCVPITSPGGHAGDDAANAQVAAYFGAPLHALPAFLTGGNFLVDGHRAAFSTCAMVGENNQMWTEAQFRQLVREYAGVTDYHITNNTENNGIQHIDCWLKVLDEETLLVKRAPTWHEEHSRIEQILQGLAPVLNTYGRPYRILRIDCLPYKTYSIAAYTNALILNRRVFVPLFNIPGDYLAMQTWATAMPGYQIVGIPWSSWYYYDALHCRTRAIFDRHMLRLTHRRLDEPVTPAADYLITTFIDDRSEAGLVADQLRVYWRVRGAAAWNHVFLLPTAQPDVYEARLPGPLPGATVEYYITAADNSGRTETLPRTAPEGFYTFSIANPGLSIRVSQPPTALTPWSVTPVGVVINPGGEQLVPGSAQLHWRRGGGPFHSTPLAHVGGNAYRGWLPRMLCSHTPEFYVSASGTQSGEKTDPPGAPAATYSAAVGTPRLRTLLSESFESGLPAGWTATGLWQVTDACAVWPACDGTRWAYYGRASGCNYNTGARTKGELLSPAVALPLLPPGGTITLHYCSLLLTEGQEGYDVALVVADTLPVDQPESSPAWEERTADLTPLAGQSVKLRWLFDSIDGQNNNYRGWQIDAVAITATECPCEFELPILPGDVNCDTRVDLTDINPFVLALTDHAGYDLTYPGCFGNADINRDGRVDFGDINPFVGLLTQPGP